MESINLDFTGVQRPSFQPIPEDNYTMILSSCKIGPGKTNKDNIVANLIYEVVEGETTGAEFSGKKVFGSQVVAGPGAQDEYTKMWLEALIGSELTGDFSLDPDSIVGLTCQAHVNVVPDYKDSTKEVNNIKYYILPF